MNLRIVYLVAGIGLTLCLGFVAQQTQPGPQTPIFHGQLQRFTIQGSPTVDDLGNLLDAVIHNTAPPTPFVFAETEGTVDATLTGLTNLSGLKRCIVTIVDDTADLTSAQLFVDGVLKSTATIANGRITDVGDGKSEALLPFWHPANYPYTIKVHWDSIASGRFIEHTLSHF